MYADLVHMKKGGPPAVHDPSYSHFNGNGASRAQEYSGLDHRREKEEQGFTNPIFKQDAEYATLDQVCLLGRWTKDTI